METKLKRYEAALQLAYDKLHTLACLGCGDDRYGNSEGNVIAADCIANMRLIIELPPKLEEVEVSSWAIIAPSGFIETTSANEELQRNQVGNPNSPFYGYQVAKLTGTYKRPKPQPIEKSVSFNGSFVLDNTNPHFQSKVLAPWRDDVPTGIDLDITVSWLESPKEEK